MASRRTSSASINAKLQQVLRLNPEAEIAFKGSFVHEDDDKSMTSI
jgi:hypothetical protein